MERESIAYFYLQKNKVAKNNFYSKIQLNEFCVERQDRLVIKAIGIPEYYSESFLTELMHLCKRKMLNKEKRRRVAWARESLIQILTEAFQTSGAEYFFYGEETAGFLRMKLPEVPLFFMEEMLLQYGIRENLILIGSPNLLFESVFQNFMQRVNFLKIVCGAPEEYEEATEWLFENYGIVAGVERNESLSGRGMLLSEHEIRSAERIEKEKDGSRERRLMETLVIDMEKGGKNGKPIIELSGLPEGTVYMDMCSEGEKARWITKKRKDIHYLSPESLLNKWCHLDTTAQNGYNTRVKLEVL